MAGWVGVARVPKEAGQVLAIQVYFDYLNDRKTVLQCTNGNWVYDADLNAIVPMLGKADNISVHNGKIVKS